MRLLFFFFNDPATTEIYPLSLHDALPICARLPVKSANCHRVLSTDIADAANYILQGVITSGTAAGRGIGIPAAGKTGTSDGGFYAAFGGDTPPLAGDVSVFNPNKPTSGGAMVDGLPH